MILLPRWCLDWIQLNAARTLADPGRLQEGGGGGIHFKHSAYPVMEIIPLFAIPERLQLPMFPHHFFVRNAGTKMLFGDRFGSPPDHNVPESCTFHWVIHDVFTPILLIGPV